MPLVTVEVRDNVLYVICKKVKEVVNSPKILMEGKGGWFKHCNGREPQTQAWPMGALVGYSHRALMLKLNLVYLMTPYPEFNL